ncbi:tetratricopeptide repeat protein [Actinoplanes sp. NPDC023936]|uniref:tetratricopeptide repeat protein n=1 Tax=Actinoplanes sp. NPDC023936 TaxID=3154910 RepID=UPI0034015B94
MTVDPATVDTLEAFHRCCDQLRGQRSYADLRRAAHPEPLPPATLSNLLNGPSIPTRVTVVTFLTACGVHGAAQAPWLAAWERARSGPRPRANRSILVRKARPRLLGVLAAIRVGGAEGELPPYVPRDFDADLRTAITAAGSGGFVLLIGGSSTGKTRALFEAVRAVFPDWWLLHPTDAEQLRAYAADPAERTLIWLDELQTYLQNPDGLSAGTTRELITDGAALVATMWPGEYHMRTARPEDRKPDVYAADRNLLQLAQVIQVPDAFSPAERRRGEALAGTDQRIRIALDTADAGFTQVLAAGPQLIQRWENAPEAECYGKAVITAALDARRVGFRHPVTREFLEAAAPAYLTPAQQASAPGDWLDRALTYATTPLSGAAACLTPAAAGMGVLAGYQSAEFLFQHAARVCRAVDLPEAAWQAVVDHHHRADTTRIAFHADRRGQVGRALMLNRTAAAGNDTLAMRQLADLLREQNSAPEAELWLRQAVDLGDRHAMVDLADLLTADGDLDEAQSLFLRALEEDHSDAWTTGYYGVWLSGLGRTEEAITWLTRAAHLDDATSACNLGFILAREGRTEEAETWARRAAADGHIGALDNLAKQFKERGDPEQSLAFSRRAAELTYARIESALFPQKWRGESGDLGASNAMLRYAEALLHAGALDDAAIWLERGAGLGDGRAARRLADLHQMRGDPAAAQRWAARAAHLSAENLRRRANRLRMNYGDEGVLVHVEIIRAYARVLEDSQDRAGATRWRTLAASLATGG